MRNTSKTTWGCSLEYRAWTLKEKAVSVGVLRLTWGAEKTMTLTMNALFVKVDEKRKMTLSIVEGIEF